MFIGMSDHGDILDGLDERQQRTARAACDDTAAAPAAQVLPVVGPIRVQVDVALGSLRDG